MASVGMGLVRPVNIDEEMREAYLDYAMSVIVARALPDARDGFKPVHRRILYAMYDMGLRSDTPYKKSARIVGDVLGKYHPHGDASVYEAMARLAQDFSLRYMLVDGQGNFGSIDGDAPAAMRYTEARLSKMGESLLTDIDRETVEFVENFDGSLTEPAVLPCAVPNMLVNGASGIAVGMSTSIPPHNLGEVCDALVYMLKSWENLDDIDTADLLRFVKGPDFPTGGVLYRQRSDEDALLAAYATGRGKLTVRAKVHVEQLGRGKSRIIVSEIPYQVNKNNLIERIADLVRDERLDGVSDLRDESDRQGLRIVIELKSNASPTEVLADLFRLTPLESTFSVIMLALVDGEPRTLSLKQALRVYLEHRLNVVRRRSEYDLARARDRAHILQGLSTALNHLNLVIKLIRESADTEAARTALMERLRLTEVQANAILEMPLRRLAALEQRKIEDELAEKRVLIAQLEQLLGDPALLRSLVSDELATMKERFSDPRRTVIADGPVANLSAGDLLTHAEPTWITLTSADKLSRTRLDAPPPFKSLTAADPDRVPLVVTPGTAADTLYLIAANGTAATVPVQQLPPIDDDPALGGGLSDLTALTDADRVIAALSVPPTQEDGYLVFVTVGGEVKRIRLIDLPGMTANTFSVMNVGSDRILAAYPVTDDDELVLVTRQAQAIRFKISEVRPTGLPAGGMRGIKLGDSGDAVIGGGVPRADSVIWTITTGGIAKCTAIGEYPVQGRAGGGVITMKLPFVAQAEGLIASKELEPLAAAVVAGLEDMLIVRTARGKFKVLHAKTAVLTARAKGGTNVANTLLTRTDRVIGVTRIAPRPATPPSANDDNRNGTAPPEVGGTPIAS
ncbi:MAG: DNA gyrase/topoisomerase IV subunit A [Aggregatilineales bacterium]